MLHKIGLDPLLPKATVDLAVLKFASASERACCSVMETYIAGWKAIDGATFQISIDGQRCVDFRVNDCLIEYHPIIIQRELSSSLAHIKYLKIMKQLPKWARRDLAELLKSEFEIAYYNKRKALIAGSKSEDLRKCELIVCTNPRDLHSKVIQRFVNQPPRFKVFAKAFSRELFKPIF